MGINQTQYITVGIISGVCDKKTKSYSFTQTLFIVYSVGPDHMTLRYTTELHIHRYALSSSHIHYSAAYFNLMLT